MSLPALDRQHVVWVGAAGTGTAFGLISAARDRWGRGVTLVAADSNPAHLVAASAIGDRFVQVPLVADPIFVERLLAGLRSEGADTYVPILDEEIVLAAELAEAGRLPEGVVLVAPSAASARICLDKLDTAGWLNRHGLPTPPTAAAANAEWNPHGLLAKPRRGLGSRGVQRLRSTTELDALRQRDDMIVQALCEPPEVTIDVFRSRRSGAVRAVCRERLEVKAGVCTKARVFDDEQLADLAGRVARGLDLTGTFCMQVMRRDGAWCITDINPRPGAGTRMTAAAGVDLLSATLADSWHLDVDALLPPLPAERFVVRQYTEFVFPNER